MALPATRPGILDINPYVPGASAAPGAVEIHKLSSNESALGASPKAVAAYQSVADKLSLYPEGASVKLREKIGQTCGLDPARIVCRRRRQYRPERPWIRRLRLGGDELRGRTALCA